MKAVKAENAKLKAADSATKAELAVVKKENTDVKATLQVIVKHLSLPCHEDCASKNCYGPLLSQCCHGSAVAKGMDCVCPDGKRCVVTVLTVSSLYPRHCPHECVTRPSLAQVTMGTLLRSPSVRTTANDAQQVPKPKAFPRSSLCLCANCSPVDPTTTHLFPFLTPLPTQAPSRTSPS